MAPLDGPLLLAPLLLLLLPLALYLYTAGVVQARFPAVANKRICLLIAHPDDEAMFFAPAVMALARPETGNHLKILCLSTGDADGRGRTRRDELVKSGLQLGLRSADDVFIVDNPADFPDSMTSSWDADKICRLLCSAFAPQLASRRGGDDTSPPAANIDLLITFDRHGVSSHPNHISLYHGARAFIAALGRRKPGWACPVDLYTLASVNLVRKYSSILDALATLVIWGIRMHHRDRAHPRRLLFMASLLDPVGLPTAWRAMTRAHKSQMVWFRYLWIAFSRYMVINDLQLDTAVKP